MHSYIAKMEARRKAVGLTREITAEHRAKMHPVWHPVFRTHPITGRKYRNIAAALKPTLQLMVRRLSRESAMLKRHYITPENTYKVGGKRNVIYTPVIVALRTLLSTVPEKGTNTALISHSANLRQRVYSRGLKALHLYSDRSWQVDSRRWQKFWRRTGAEWPKSLARKADLS